MTLVSKLIANINTDLSSALDLVTAEAKHAIKKTMNLADGTGANQADKVFSDERTLAASATENIDLAGTLTDAFGATITLARVKLLAIFAAAANTNNVEVGGAAANGFINWVKDATDVVVVRPGGWLILAAPDATAYAVTADTGDLLKIANSGAGTPVTYQIVVIGASA